MPSLRCCTSTTHGRTVEWIPNRYGGKENLDALDFLRRVNEQVYGAYPDVDDDRRGIDVVAAWCRGPSTSAASDSASSGIWAGCTTCWITCRRILSFAAITKTKSPSACCTPSRKTSCLPLSHDEVVYGKRSMIGKMPGDDWQKFANLRLLYGFMFGHPGKKLLFMGDEFGQWAEWNHDSSLDWHLLQQPFHSGLLRWVRDLNTFYRGQPSLFEVDFDASGFEWVDCSDSQRSVVCFLRRGKNPADKTLFACNFTPVPRPNYRVGVPSGGALARDAEQRCSALRRQRPGKRRRRDSDPFADPRPAVFAEFDTASARRRGSPARGAKCLISTRWTPA